MTRIVYLCLVSLCFASVPTRADIFQWEYLNPADPSQGKQQSTTLCPDGAGQVAEQYAQLQNDLTKAYLIGADLRDAHGTYLNLTNADLSQANLTNMLFYENILTGATLSQANLTGVYIYDTKLAGADFTGADVRRASFFGDTAGLDPEKGLSLAQLYSTASYATHDLTGIVLDFQDLSGANFAGQNFTSAWFVNSTLVGADFTGADVRGAYFGGYSADLRLTVGQLNSTASYESNDLGGIHLEYHDLSGANLAGQNLTGATLAYTTLAGTDFSHANLRNANLNFSAVTGANFTGAQVQGANFDVAFYFPGGSNLTPAQLYSTASYQAHDLAGINLASNNLSGWNFAGQNLAGAVFYAATLTGADFTGANVQGADLSTTSFTATQLYSTASYQAHDLMGIRMNSKDLTGWNFAGQNLASASVYYANFTNADLSNANLTNANLSDTRFTGANLHHANLTNAHFGNFSSFGDADLRGADTRGASGAVPGSIGVPNFKNLINDNGHIAGLDLTAGTSLFVRDYDGNPSAFPPTGPLPIIVDQHAAISTGGVVRMVFETDAWDSTISFASGIPVALGGTLELTFADDVNVASQIGRTFDLFNWTGVAPSGAFAVSSPYTWNLANLYTTGEVTLTATPNLPGDFNHDGTVDAADYVLWRKNPGGTYTQDDYNIWRAHFCQTFSFTGSGSSSTGSDQSAAVPEPSTDQLLILAAAGVLIRRNRVRADAVKLTIPRWLWAF